jgi:hypothetical protein
LSHVSLVGKVYETEVALLIRSVSPPPKLLKLMLRCLDEDEEGGGVAASRSPSLTASGWMCAVVTVFETPTNSVSLVSVWISTPSGGPLAYRSTALIIALG